MKGFCASAWKRGFDSWISGSSRIRVDANLAGYVLGKVGQVVLKYSFLELNSSALQIKCLCCLELLAPLVAFAVLLVEIHIRRARSTRVLLAI